MMIIQKNGTYIIKINDRWYLNPAYEEVRNYVADGVREIAENYNIDGIHIDDYFILHRKNHLTRQHLKNRVILI